MRRDFYPKPTSSASRQTLRQDEFEVSYTGQRGSVWLRDPDDLDLIQEIGYGRLTIAKARKIVAVRRRLAAEMESTKPELVPWPDRWLYEHGFCDDREPPPDEAS
jgi:hypothetical protein